MCYHYQLAKPIPDIEKQFQAEFLHPEIYQPLIFNGFLHQKAPVIPHSQPDKIDFFSWGLIPHWAKDSTIQKNTLNARIETIAEKPSFKYVLKNRCLILADAFFEWQWLDPQGKKKQKFKLTLPDESPFAFAGLWSHWQEINTFTILTGEADELMSEIHNSKKRMPLILATGTEKNWLNGQNMETQNHLLVAEMV